MRGVLLRLDQGLNLNPSSSLGLGELGLARNSHYLPDDQTLRTVGGSVSAGVIAAAQARGLVAVTFRSGSRFLVGAAGTTIASSPFDGVWTSRKTLGATAGLMEGRYYEHTDRLYLFDGTNTPQVWSGSGSTRNAGLTAPTTLTKAIVANASTRYVTGSTFQYCFTEYDDVNLVESSPSAVIQVQTTATGNTIRLNIPTKLNSATTKFRIYRSQDGGDVMFLLAEISSTLVRYYDGVDSEALGSGTDNVAVWGFATVDDIFLSTRPTVPMLGTPTSGNYVSVNGTIPNGDIIAFYDESLLIAGVPGYPADIYYSMEGKPEQFSPFYVLREGNALGDPVTAIGTANERLIAFTVNGVFRHDKLPRITDPGYGIATSTRIGVTSDAGCIAKRTVVGFGVESPNSRVFYLSLGGPRITDAYQTRPIGGDLDWSSRVLNMSAISGAVAINYPRQFQIWLWLPSKNSSYNDHAWIYHYHPGHAKKSTGLGKWTGPIHMRCSAAAVAYQRNAEAAVYVADADNSGTVYQIDSGTADAQLFDDPSGKINWEWKTGDMPIGAQSRNKRFGRVFLNIDGAADFAPSLKYAIDQRDQEHQIQLANTTVNAASTEKVGASTVDANKTRTIVAGVWQTGARLRLHMQESSATSSRGIVDLEVETEDFGERK